MLYIPKIHSNLVSVSQLVKEHKCFVTITDELCVIQDHPSYYVVKNFLGCSHFKNNCSVDEIFSPFRNFSPSPCDWDEVDASQA